MVTLLRRCIVQYALLHGAVDILRHAMVGCWLVGSKSRRGPQDAQSLISTSSPAAANHRHQQLRIIVPDTLHHGLKDN